MLCVFSQGHGLSFVCVFAVRADSPSADVYGHRWWSSVFCLCRWRSLFSPCSFALPGRSVDCLVSVCFQPPFVMCLRLSLLASRLVCTLRLWYFSTGFKLFSSLSGYFSDVLLVTPVSATRLPALIFIFYSYFCPGRCCDVDRCSFEVGWRCPCTHLPVCGTPSPFHHCSPFGWSCEPEFWGFCAFSQGHGLSFVCSPSGRMSERRYVPFPSIASGVWPPLVALCLQLCSHSWLVPRD